MVQVQLGGNDLVSIGSFESEGLVMKHGVPQGRVVGLLLFSLYTLPLGQIMQKFKAD